MCFGELSYAISMTLDFEYLRRVDDVNSRGTRDKRPHTIYNHCLVLNLHRVTLMRNAQCNMEEMWSIRRIRSSLS
jgi:hypothetical protein